jgi:hypothetical protein
MHERVGTGSRTRPPTLPKPHDCFTQRPVQLDVEESPAWSDRHRGSRPARRHLLWSVDSLIMVQAQRCGLARSRELGARSWVGTQYPPCRRWGCCCWCWGASHVLALPSDLLRSRVSGSKPAISGQHQDESMPGIHSTALGILEEGRAPGEHKKAMDQLPGCTPYRAGTGTATAGQLTT